MKQPYNTALYYRLSRDDENFGDSVSIETQRTILQQFARDNQFHVVDEYIDDGWSGTNFDRPAFQRMMDDVDAGRINCIITKDLSRFGREHVMIASNAFDPYPFILLNLVLSCVAAIQAPLIMMSQNRQEEKDRRRAENDYKVNLKTEIMIEDLYDKVNAILAKQSALEKKLQEQEDQTKS